MSDCIFEEGVDGSGKVVIGEAAEQIALHPGRPVDRARPLVLAGLIVAFVAALVTAVPQFDVSKKCHAGAFSSGFSSAFDVSYCDLVIRTTGSDFELRFRLPDAIGRFFG
jgi:hypothetical protein